MHYGRCVQKLSFNLQAIHAKRITLNTRIMPKNLVIVESPAKAKTIEKFLGADFKVESSFGHIRDLVSKGMGIEIEKNFTPIYEVSKDKREVVKKLKKLSSEVETVWLASDEDREGEAISWHLAETLKLNPTTTNRIVFHEITKNAILKAIENPRKIDVNLVNAQQARRVLDRLVGFELSPVLWRKIRSGLSAGRVQSVAVRLIVDREREIQAFNSNSTYRVVAQFFTDKGEILPAELDHRFETKEEAENFLKHCISAGYQVSDLETKPAKRNPAAPFTTSTLQQEASRKLGFSVARTMQIAQKLYESGLITYMRTDSVNLSEEAIAAAQAEINSYYGVEYSQSRRFNTKNKSAQEAHEAIRPTYMDRHTAGADPTEKKLYDLIWKRTIASQMAEAKLERTTAHINVSQSAHQFVAKGEVLLFDGFLKVYMEGTDDEEQEEKNMLPRITVNEVLTRNSIQATERYSRPKPRFTEASLVKELEENGIGRPSTYAPTISTIMKRGYVEKSDLEGTVRPYFQLTLEGNDISEKTLTEKTGADKGKLMPTDIGSVVTDFLKDNFDQIMDYSFTAQVEEEFDKIAEGKEDWVRMIEDFYGSFHSKIEDTQENAERATGERNLGTHPENGKLVLARIGRYGPMVQIGTNEDEDKPQFASIPKELHIETITLEEALNLFKLPRKIGKFEDLEITIGSGRFGPYVLHNKKFVSLKKEMDPMKVTLEEAIELIKEKREAEANMHIAVFEEKEPKIEVSNGRYGPYIKSEKKNYKIPKGTDPKGLTREDCENLIAEQSKTTKAKARK